jgi:hypothetical protein
MMRIYVLGCDPGGADSNGIAIAELVPDVPVVKPTLLTHTTSTVRGAIDWIMGETGDGKIAALGIDTLTCWSIARSGERPADRFLRGLNVAKPQSVVAPNSLRGAMAIGGAAFLITLRERWKRDATMITETHPKVLYSELSKQEYNWKESHASMADWISNIFYLQSPLANDHEFDAALSVFSALQGYHGKWTVDLHHSAAGELTDIVEYIEPTHFWWPSK